MIRTTVLTEVTSYNIIALRSQFNIWHSIDYFAGHKYQEYDTEKRTVQSIRSSVRIFWLSF